MTRCLAFVLDTSASPPALPPQGLSGPWLPQTFGKVQGYELKGTTCALFGYDSVSKFVHGDEVLRRQIAVTYHGSDIFYSK